MKYMKPPVENGKTYKITIHDIGSHGEGIGQYEDFTVFVPHALPGETVEVKIDTLKKNYAKGTCIRRITETVTRTQPTCSYYPECGGCQLQHFDYAAQLDWKRNRVQTLIERIGGITVEVQPVLGMETPYDYRNKMQMPVGGTVHDSRIGFYAAGSHRIIDMEYCAIQDEANNQILQAVRQTLAILSIEPYNEQSHTGVIRHIIGRTGTHGTMVIIVTATKTLPHAKQWISELRRRLPKLRSLYHNYQPEKNNIIMGNQSTLLWGEGQLVAHIDDLQFHLSPGSFFQVNPKQTEVLYKTALEYAQLTGIETVIDAYCGTGTISLFLARHAKHVIGIEIFAPAIADACFNARQNQITNAEFIVGDATQEMPKLAAKGIRPAVIVMDPARAGCTPEVLQAVMKMSPERIVYVSCNPATLARDLATLTTQYDIRRVQPVDMFPHTTHIECVCLLERVK